MVGLVLSIASATAWAERHEVEGDVRSDGRGIERLSGVDRRGAGPSIAAGESDGVDDAAPPMPDPTFELTETIDADAGALLAPGVGEAAPIESVGRPGADPIDDAGERRDQGVARALGEWMSQHDDVRSVAVAVATVGPSGPTWSGAFGEPLLDHTAAYPIMSVTKTFTQALVLREAGEGRIDLDAGMPPIPDVAPVPDGVHITPRMLLQHTSGLVNYMEAPGYDPSAPMTPARAVSLSLEAPLLAEPGTRAHYSNSNYHWLGLLLEHATGRTFEALVAELAGQYGLLTTRVDVEGRPGWVGFASGGMRATLADVARWGAHLFDPGAVLSPPALEAYRTVGALGVGLGVWPICPCTTAPDGAVDYTAVGQIVADGGLLYFPDEDVVVAVRLANVPGDVGTITASVAGAVAAAFGDDPPARVQ